MNYVKFVFTFLLAFVPVILSYFWYAHGRYHFGVMTRWKARHVLSSRQAFPSSRIDEAVVWAQAEFDRNCVLLGNPGLADGTLVAGELQFWLEQTEVFADDRARQDRARLLLGYWHVHHHRPGEANRQASQVSVMSSKSATALRSKIADFPSEEVARRAVHQTNRPKPR